MTRLIGRLDAASAWIAKALAVLAGVFLVFMAVLACSNMVMRAMTTSIKGTVELIGFCGAVVTAFSLAQTQIRKGHIVVALLTQKMGKVTQRVLDSLANMISAVFFLFAAYETATWGWSLVVTGELSETLRIIYYPFVFAAALGCVSIAFVLLVEVLKDVSGTRTSEAG